MRKTSVCIFTLLLLAALSLAAAPAATQSASSAPAATTPAASTTTTTTATTATTTKSTKHVKHPHCKAAKGAVSDKAAECATFKVGDRSFSGNKDTTYWVGKKKGTCADLENGDKASVTCVTKDGVDWAKSVKIWKPKAVKTTTTTTTVTPPPHK